MSMTIQEQINLIQMETESLSKSVKYFDDSSVSLHFYVTIELLTILIRAIKCFFNTKKVVRLVKELDINIVIDSDDILIDSLKKDMDTIKSGYIASGILLEKKINRLNRLLIKINRFLSKKIFDDYNLAITLIMEHDADADTAPYSEAFDSVDDLMKHLNS